MCRHVPSSSAEPLSFTDEILIGDPEDVADTLDTLRAAALGHARGAHPAPGARTTAT
jgi:hypothetical protein